MPRHYIQPRDEVVTRAVQYDTILSLRTGVAGNYLLQFDMVVEYVHWFSDLGGDGLILELRIEG